MATDLTALAGRVRLDVSMTAEKNVTISAPADQVTVDENFAFAFGTGAASANQMWASRRTLASAANETLDLVGSLTNAFGGTINFTRLKAIIIVNRSDEADPVSAATLKLEPGATPPDNSPTIQLLPAGGIFVLACGDANGLSGANALAGGSKDGIKITNNTTGSILTYDIIVIGESA